VDCVNRLPVVVVPLIIIEIIWVFILIFEVLWIEVGLLLIHFSAIALRAVFILVYEKFLVRLLLNYW